MNRSETLQLGLCPEHSITLAYYTAVTNGPEIKRELSNLDCAIINAALIVDVLQVMAAANKTQWCKDTNSMRTRNINTELLYRLSPSTNVRQEMHHSYALGYRDPEFLWRTRGYALHAICKV